MSASSAQTDSAFRAAGVVARTLISELTRPVAPPVTTFVSRMVGAARPLGVLFYGSLARSLTTASPGEARALLEEGILDFYVIVERQSDWPRSLAARLANAILPPNVEYHEIETDGLKLRAKVAILTLKQFRALTRPGCRDTSVWSRFSQPVRLVWVRDSAAADAVLRCVIRAVGTAALWAAKLGPAQDAPEAYWDALYRQTYGAELRVESKNRATTLIAGEEARYSRLLTASWVAGLLPHAAQTANGLTPGFSAWQRKKARKRWRARTRFGRPLNALRLIKAAFTFTGGARYLAWKIERHSGIPVPLSPFAERHPVLCAPAVLVRLIRAGVFSR